MASVMATRRLQKEARALSKNPLKNPTIIAVPNEDNILEWHYVIEGGKGTPYEGGHYHGKLIFPKEYPLKPPSVIMLTPSGRFQPNRRLCLSMSDFHPETWNPMWSVSTILTGLYSFMIDRDPTLGSIETTDTAKRIFARQSLLFNVSNPDFCRIFPHLVELSKQRQSLSSSSTSDRVTPLSSTIIRQPRNAGAHGVIVALATAILAVFSLLFALKLV
jgi:ubiquitin-conjugating enzyme E2 J2